MSNNSEDSDSLLDEIFMREYVEDNEIDDGKLNFFLIPSSLPDRLVRYT